MENNRCEARKKAEEWDKRADIKQHADKIFQGLEKLNDGHAKRAIWELFQNAIDLSEKCEVVITITDESVEFKHNGKPFTSETLIFLIKQVSSKDSKNNNDEVGQYGTGFLSTHSFSKKILLSGCLKEPDFYIHFNDFEINRAAKNSDELIEKLEKQKSLVFDLVENGHEEKENRQHTTFKYITITEQEKQYAENTISDLKLILPYVMTINSKLQKVTVIDKQKNNTIYKKEETRCSNDLIITPICINQTTTTVYSITSQNQDITIILPLEEQNTAVSFDVNLAKLFLFYPLIGTEDFGVNFLIHSKYFVPVEQRDGIYLCNDNEQIQEKAENNRKLLEKALNLLTDYLIRCSNDIKNSHFFAKLYFNTNIPNNPSLSGYFKEIKHIWVEEFKKIPLVETAESKCNSESILFFSEELLEDDDYFDSIYSIVNLFWKNIPKKEISKIWTEYVTQWEYPAINYITIKQVAEKIQETKTLDFYKNENANNLKHFYEYLINISQVSIFDKYELLPNIKNEFKRQRELKTYSEIDDILIEIADVIISDIPKFFVFKEFELGLGFNTYEIKAFETEINAKLSDIAKSGEGANNILPALIKYCSIFGKEENKGKRGELLKLIMEYYEVEEEYRTLQNLPKEWWSTPIRCLFSLFTRELELKDEDWIKEKEDFLYNLLLIVDKWSEVEDHLKSKPLFPNQNFKLCSQNDLKIDDNIVEELKDLYDKIIQPEKTIRDTLILGNFNCFLRNGENRKPIDLGNEIEEKFKIQDCKDTKEHEYIKDILYIIEHTELTGFFPIIDSKKSQILLEQFSDGETKKDLFSIISSGSDKIKALGELSRMDNFEQIIEEGKASLEEKQRSNALFEFKKFIGTHIEKIVREKIGGDLINLKIEVDEQQGGQDIIVKYNGKTIFNIEVKSRWDNRNSIMMSSVQMEKAVENKDIYALCCVEMCDYKIGEEDRYNVTNIQEILDRIKVISDIGNKIEPLLKGVLAVKDIENEISLIDYRGTIPQNLVKKGITLDDFISKLIDLYNIHLKNI
jgi:hypothetical protein